MYEDIIRLTHKTLYILRIKCGCVSSIADGQNCYVLNTMWNKDYIYELLKVLTFYFEIFNRHHA